MTLDSSPVSITILLTWLLHLVIAFNLKSQSKRTYAYYQGLWKILGYVGLALVLIEIVQIVPSIAYGYFYEQLVFYDKFLGFWFWWMFALDVFVPLLFCLNLWLKFSSDKGFRSFQLALIIAIFWTRVAFGNDANISIIPGWYAIVDFISFPMATLIAGGSILWLNWRNLKA